MLESSVHDDGEKWAQEAPRADGHRGSEVRKRIRVAGAGLWGAALPEWRSAKRIRALDGISDDRNDGVFDAAGTLRNLHTRELAESGGAAGEYRRGGVPDCGVAADKEAQRGITDSSEQITGTEEELGFVGWVFR